MKKKILLRMPCLSASGYGENSRFILRALKEYEEYFDIFLINTNWGQTAWLWTDDEERHYIDNLIQKTIIYNQQGGGFNLYDISIQCTIPNEIEQLAPVNILVSALIETDKAAAQWIEKSKLVNKIITISQHAKDVLLNTLYQARNNQTGEIIPEFKCTTPVDIVHYPVRTFNKETKLDIDFDTPFNFLCVAQWSIRKNLEQTIIQFVEEFHNKEDVGLVLKINLKNNSVMDREFVTKRLNRLLSRFPNRKCKIHLLHGFLTEAEMDSLYRHPKIKAMISIAHGESFGLPIFEAAYNGLPVISHLYGGQRDFLCIPVKDKKTNEIINKPLFSVVEGELKPIQPEAVWDGVLVADSKWLYPDATSYRYRLRQMYSEHPRLLQQAERLKKYLIEKFTEKEQNRKLVSSILGYEVKKVEVEDLPKIDVITSLFNAKEHLEGLCKDITQQTVFESKVNWVIVHPKTSPTYLEEKEIVLKYKEQFPNNIQYIELEEDKGLYDCWNLGIKASSNPIISNWNCDDRRSKEALAKELKEFALDEGVSLVYNDSLITDQPNETFENNSSNGRKYNFPLPGTPEENFETEKNYNAFNHANSVFKRELIEKYGYFDETLKSAGDWEFCLRTLLKKIKIKKMDEPLSLYFFNPKGISTDPENFKWKRLEEKQVFQKYKDLKVEKE